MKDLTHLFQKIYQKLQTSDFRWALAGGLAASIYREQIRATQDLDFAIIGDSHLEQDAKKVLETIGFRPTIATKAHLEGGPHFKMKPGKSPSMIIVGREPVEHNPLGVDFLLPLFPWVPKAVERAQNNKIDFGFGLVPVVTKEDLILSKFYSLEQNSSRIKDLDDLIEIFKAQKSLDLIYISSQMNDLQILIPKSFEKSAPDILRKISKRIRTSSIRQQKG